MSRNTPRNRIGERINNVMGVFLYTLENVKRPYRRKIYLSYSEIFHSNKLSGSNYLYNDLRYVLDILVKMNIINKIQNEPGAELIYSFDFKGARIYNLLRSE